MAFHHIGIATRDIEASVKAYSAIGYVAGNVIFDSIQQVNLCFLDKYDSPTIELVSPMDDLSPVSNILKKNGTMPYHTCYEVDDLENEIQFFKKSKFLLVLKPVPAIAFNNRKICFLYHKDAGLIELLEK